MTINRFLFLLIFCSLSLYSFTQPYKSVFGKDTTKWIVRYSIPDLTEFSLFKAFDTGASKNEKKIYEVINNTNKFSGILKEDTASGKLWHGNRLIMDMSLKKNDTFQGAVVDTTFLRNGSKIIIFNYVLSFGEPLSFIEGVGPNNSFYLVHYLSDHAAVLMTSCKDNVVAYNGNDSKATDCNLDLPISSIEIINNAPLNIYPNPFSDIINVFSEIKNSNLTILNSQGEKIITYHLNIGSNIFNVS